VHRRQLAQQAALQFPAHRMAGERRQAEPGDHRFALHHPGSVKRSLRLSPRSIKATED